MRSAFLIFIILASAACLRAQEFRATFSGAVTDEQGAAIPKVKIVAIAIQTGVKSETIAGSGGEYTIPFLTPGEYEINAEAPGFKRYVRRGLTLATGEHPIIDIRLEVGATTQNVTVTADAPLIDASSGSVGQVITSEEVADFPMNGGMPMMLAQLALGLISTSEPGPVRPFDTAQTALFTMGGAPGQANEFLLNGASNTGATKNMAYSPPQGAVMELRVHAFESDAAFGHTGAGTVNQIIKGGTNAFHGSGSEFNQVSNLAANMWFSNKNGVKRPVYHYNQYGLAGGGPVWIPKVFNGKNRVFWFAAWEGLRDSNPANSPLEGGATVTTVPTLAERKGDFSALLAVNTSYTIYDPATGVTSGSHTARTPFPNNVIPGSRLNKIALNYLPYYPSPNIPGRADGYNNYGIDIANSNQFNNVLGRFDVRLSDKSSLSYNMRHGHRVQDKNHYFKNEAAGTTYQGFYWGASIDEVYSITPTLVTNIRANWTRIETTSGSRSDGFDPTTLGFPSYIASSSKLLQMPYLAFGSCGSYSSYHCIGANSNNRTPHDSYQIFADIVKFRGNHSFKTGVDVRDYRKSTYAPGNSVGSYTFASTWTTGPLENAAGSPLGQDFAGFLLGLPTSGRYDLNTHSTAHTSYYALFVQDDWRASKNLTINLGLRWEHEGPTVERFNRAVNGFDPSVANPISNAAAAAYVNKSIPEVPVGQFGAKGGLTFTTPGRERVYSTSTGMFSPRFGIAWVPKALGGGTVIRGGLATFVSPIGINGTLALNQQGFSQTTQFVATSNNYLSPAGTLSDPFPNGIVPPPGSSQGAGTFLGQQITFFNPEARNSYSIRWVFGVQRQLPGKMVMEAAYIGNHAVHLAVTSKQLDYVPRQYFSTSPFRDGAVISQLTGTVPNPLQGLLPNASSLNGATVARQQLLIPYPQYPVGSGAGNGVIEQYDGAGSAYFHSLNVRLQKRFTHGMTLINNFIWSQVIERTAYLNDSDAAPEKRVSPDSRPLREVLGITFELPVGKGKRFDLRSRAGNAVLGGWSLNGMLTLQLGPPLTWGNVLYNGGPLQMNAHQADVPAFDVTRFNTVANQQLVYNIRDFHTTFNNLRRDPTKNCDVSALKRFTLTERKYLQFRFEAFNVSNRVGFNSPNVTPANSAFGMITSTANNARKIQMGARLIW